MNRFGAAAAILSVLLAGCSGGPETVSAAAPGKAAAESAPTGVIIGASAQANGNIRAVAVALKPLPLTITANGQVLPNGDRTWNVGSFVSGRVAESGINLGDRVAAGQILMRMHSHEIHDTRAAFLQARELLRQRQARATYLEGVRDRARRLLAVQAISREQSEQAESEWRAAMADVESARAGVESERTHLTEMLEVPFTPQGDPEDVDTVPVHAPAGGTVIERKATLGTVVTPGDTLLTISDLSSVWVVVNLNEADLGAVRVGQQVRVQVKAWPDQELTGRVVKLGESLDPQTRTLQVRVLVPNGAGMLKPEMFATVSVETTGARQALLVPREAIQDVNGQTCVFVQMDGEHFRVQPVTLGAPAGLNVEIAQGLSAGDRVVDRGSFVVKSELLKRSLSED
ncbi:MAG: efflux RND transporter periplasmic adaptor subunit [Acidobacteriota bacterium]|nr:efflux RND transporter periplasmic adaptor subunit [Acidobacteriota bacterium]